MDNLIEYMNIHLISLRQDLEQIEDLPSKDSENNYLVGAISATEHLLSVATDILSNNIQGKGY